MVSDNETYHRFGTSVAVEGRTLIVGAAGANDHVNGFENVGRVNGVWQELQILSGPSNTNGGGYGSSVALDGNRLLFAGVARESGFFEKVNNVWVPNTSADLSSVKAWQVALSGHYWFF